MGIWSLSRLAESPRVFLFALVLLGITADPTVAAGLQESACRGVDNPLHASPCRGGGYCANVSDFGMSRMTGSRRHLDRVAGTSALRGDHGNPERADEDGEHIAAMCGGNPSSETGVFGFSGEFHRTEVDLFIQGRGHDFVWSRTYRSRTGPISPMGQSWDHGYNIHLLEIADGPTEADRLVFLSGTELHWDPPTDPGGDPADLRYCTLRSPDVRDFTGPAVVILDPEQPDTLTQDVQDPAPGTLFSYLILPKNGSRPGPLGSASDGTPRTGLSCGVTGPDLLVHDGTGRRDLFTKRDPIRWMAPELMLEIQQNPDGSYTATFPDTGRWDFAGPGAGNAEGKIESIVDRNGNAIELSYDAAGRLTTILDTLGRPITLAYAPNGFVQSVTDFSGRQVVYDYYTAGDPDGATDDLRSVRSPVVVGTPNGNDYPSGKETVYTYSTGFADEQLNHNLLTITDPKGQLWLQNFYAPTLDPLQLDYDRVTHQLYGGLNDRIDYVYLPQTPVPANDFATLRAVANDRAGNVRETFFDARNYVVQEHWYAGRASNPGAPTDDVLNRPVNPLRPTDPVRWEVRRQYNDDGRMTLIELPTQSLIEIVYDELNPDRRSQGNPLSMCRLPGPPGGSPPQLCDVFEYDTAGPGTAGTNFVARHVDARGHETRHIYDAAGNRTQTIHRLPSIVEDFEYNGFGQLTAHTLPDNGSGHRRRDEYTYYPQTGYLEQQIIDATNLALTTTYDYDSRGNVTRTVDPLGADTLMDVNALDQLVRRTSRETQPGSNVRYETTYFYDPNDNLVRVDVENRDENGLLDPNPLLTTVYEYEILNHRVRSCEEVEPYFQPIPGQPGSPDCSLLPQAQFLVTEFQYDANRNLVLERSGVATDGSQPDAVVTHLYDERDLLFQSVRAPGVLEQSTSQLDYDVNGNPSVLIQGLEGTPRATSMVYDGYDRLLGVTDPLGNTEVRVYDANRNLVDLRVEGELLDQPGSLANVRLHETVYVYDAMDRLIRQDVSHFDGDTQAPIGDGISRVVYDYTDTSQVRFITDDNGNVTDVVYDTANRTEQVEDPKGNRQTYLYDANSNLTQVTETEKSDLGLPDEVYVTTFTYDGLDRQVRSLDNAGNEIERLYDSRHNVRVTLDATNGAGSSGNLTRFHYDGVDRLVLTEKDLTQDGTGGTPKIDEIEWIYVWDDADRLIEATDDAGNTTSYAYDPLHRRTLTTHPDFTQHSWLYDVHDNIVEEQDSNGSILLPLYDLLNRMVRLDVAPGPGVSGATTFENFDYDGVSRMVRAEDDDSVVDRSHDSLSHVIRETLDGQQTQSSYDGDGNRLQSVYPGGRVIDYAYDSLNRMATATSGQALIAEYQYIGPGSRVERRGHGNGTETFYSYDGIANPPGDSGVRQTVRTQHLDGIGGVLDDRVYAWDPMQNKLHFEDVTPGGPGTRNEYTYDSVYRLTRSVRSATALPPAPTQYVLDGVGNRRQVAGGPDPGPYQLDPNDEPVNLYTQTSFDERLYDDNGNTTTTTDLAGILPPVSYTYDYADRLVERQDPGRALTTNYDYDALGRRIRRVVTDPVLTTETRYYYDGWQVCEERDGGGATTATYVYGLYVDEVVEMERPGGSFYFHADDMYNTVAVTDATGSVRERFEYQDYGEPLFFDGLGNPQPRSFLEVPYLFTGRRLDHESGLYWYRTRYMDPRAGRFTSRDTIGAWGDTDNHGNGQAYAGNNPATRADPFGLAAVFPPFRNGDPITPEEKEDDKDSGAYGGGGGGSGGRIAIHYAHRGGGGGGGMVRSSAEGGDYNSSRSNKTHSIAVHGSGNGNENGEIKIIINSKKIASYGGGGGGGRIALIASPGSHVCPACPHVVGGGMASAEGADYNSSRSNKTHATRSSGPGKKRWVKATYNGEDIRSSGPGGGSGGSILIEVKPNPKLHIDYYLQRGLFGGGGDGSVATEKALKKGDRVALVGFGSFSISKRAARTGRKSPDPHTDAANQLSTATVKNKAKFKAGADLSKKVN